MKPQGNRSRSISGGMLWNLLTVLMLLASFCLIYYFVSVFLNPGSPFNPFPPESLPTLVLYPTETITPLAPPATWTPTLTREPSPTRTLAPTWTNLYSSPYFTTVTTSPSAATPSMTGAPMTTTTKTLASVNITYLSSTTYHLEAGCSWMGVAGQAVDRNNNPILYLTVHLSGTLEGKAIDYYSLTGTAASYGLSGFEFVLGDHPVTSSGTLWIQLLDQASLPLTEKVYFDTYSDCSKNLVMIRFRKTE